MPLLNKVRPLILTLLLLCFPISVFSASTQFFPAKKVELEKYELYSTEIDNPVKIKILSICLSPVFFLLIWYVVLIINHAILKVRHTKRKNSEGTQ